MGVSGKGNPANLTRAGMGRPKGSLNKATVDIKALAAKHAEEAFRELARLATEAENEGTRVAAIKELLDRGYGKAQQSVAVGQDPTLMPMGVVELPRKDSPRDV